MSDIFSAEGKDWFISIEISSWLSNMITEEVVHLDFQIAFHHYCEFETVYNELGFLG